MDDSSNRRKTRSSGRKKASTKVADSQDSNQIPDGAEAKSKSNGASPGRSSPEPDCAICLGRLQNKSFTDRCFHMFCFVCLQEWSKVKAECPLCKQKFTSIIHNVRSNEDYDQYPIPPKIPSWEEQARNFRYHTTLTLERRLQINIPDFRQHPQYQEHDYTLQRPSLHNHMTTRSHWRRQRQASSSDFRRRIYTNNLRLVEVTDPRMRTRDTTPSFFRSNPACTHRLVPWLNRELNALLQGQHEHVQFVLELIMDRIKNVAITSEEFYQGVYPYVGRYTRHFMHEFEHFARSPYNIAAYDQHAVYQPQTLAVESDSDTDSILSVGNDNDDDDDDDDDDDVIVISPSQETGRRHQPSPPHRQRERGSLTYRDLSPLLHRVRSLLEYPDSSHLSVNTPGWDSPTPGPSWAAETEVSDLSAAVAAVDEETVLEDGLRTMGNAHTLKTEDERDIDVENSRSNSSSDDSDSDSSKAGSDIVFVGYDRPWQERSPILLLSSSDDNDNVTRSTANSAVDRKSKHDKKSKTERHKKRDSEISKNHWKPSKRRRSRSRSWSRSRSRSRSSPRHESYWRKRSHSRSRSKYVSGHRRHRSRSRERSGSKRKRISSPSSLEQSFTYDRSRSSLLSWDQKRHRSKSSSVEITYVKRKKSKHKKKEKKHHKKHKNRKHKKRRRVSDSEDSQASKIPSVSRPRSSVTVVIKSQESLQKPEDHHRKENKTPDSDKSTDIYHSSILQPISSDSSKTSSAKTATPDSKSLGSTTITGSPDSKVTSNYSSDSKATSVESNINKKPYKKHPTGHKKSSQNKALSQCTSVDHEHNSYDSAQPSNSYESSSPVKNGNMSGASSQSTENSDRDIDGQASNITDQEKLIRECQVLSPSAVRCPSESGGDGLDIEVGDHNSENITVPNGRLEIQRDGISSNVADEDNCNSDISCENSLSGTTESCTEFQPNTNNKSIHQNLIPTPAVIVSTSNGKDSKQPSSDCTSDENKKVHCELQGRDILPVLSSNAESSFNTTDDGTDSCVDTTGKYQSSPGMANSPGPSTPPLVHQTSTIEILDSDSSLNSDSDNESTDCEESVESGACNDRRSCVIVTSPSNAAIGYPSDGATEYPRYSSEQEISSSAMSEANILANSNSNLSQPSSPCLYSSPSLMYSSPMGTSLAIPSFNSLFHSSSASIMRTDGFVSNMAVSISTAGVQSQHMTNHVYRASPGGQWESHHSAHSISRANMGNVELVQTMSGVAHNNLYGSTCSATSSTMAYIPRTTCGTCLPNATSVQTYTNTEQSFNHSISSGQQHVPTTSQTLVTPNTSSQNNCPLNRARNEDNSQISLSSLPSYYTSPSSSSLWSHDRHIEVADSSEGDADVDVLYLSDNEDEFREINIMDVTDEEESDDESHVVDLGSVDLISDDSDVEIEETSGPTDSVCRSMIRAVLPHGSVSEAVLEDDAERSRRTTCDLSVCVSDEEDTTSHINGHLNVYSSSEEDSNLLCGASSSEDKILDENVNGKENVSSNQKTLGTIKSCENLNEESDYITPSRSTVNYQSTSIIDSYEETDKQVSAGSSSNCHYSGSQPYKAVPSDYSSDCHSSGSELDKPISSDSRLGFHDSSSQKYSPSNESNTERDVNNRIGNLSCSYNRVICEVPNTNNDIHMCDSSEKHDRRISSVCGSSDNEDQHNDCGSSENENQNIESMCGSSDNEERNIDSMCGSSNNEVHNINSACGSSDNEDQLIDCSSSENENQNVESVGGSASDNEDRNIDSMCGSSEHNDRNTNLCNSPDNNSSLSTHRNAISPVCNESSSGVNEFVGVNENPDSSGGCNNIEASECMSTCGSDTGGTMDSGK